MNLLQDKKKRVVIICFTFILVFALFAYGIFVLNQKNANIGLENLSIEYTPNKVLFGIGETIDFRLSSPNGAIDPDRYEFCLWKLSQDDQDWVLEIPYQALQNNSEVSQENQFTIAQYTFFLDGRTALQIDIREKDTGFEKQFWINEFVVAINPIEEWYVSYLPNKSIYSMGETIDILVSPSNEIPELERYEYCIWMLTEEHQDWVLAMPYQTMSVLYDEQKDLNFFSISQYAFSHEGSTALQIDIRDRLTGLEKKYWINEFIAGYDHSWKVSFDPYKSCFALGDTIDIRISESNKLLDLSGIEYSLWEKPENYADWVQVSPYQGIVSVYSSNEESWLTGNRRSMVGTTIAQHTFTNEGVTSLQINVRDIASKKESRLWLGQFFIQQSDDYKEKIFLMRDILLAYQDNYDDYELYRNVAEDLKIALGAYYYFSQGESEKARTYIMDGLSASAGVLEYNDALGALLYENNAVFITAGSLQPLNNVIALFKDKDFDFVLAAMINTVLYNHYEYGALFSDQQRHTLRDWVACCVCFSKDFYTILSYLGYDTSWLNVSNPDGTLHAICEVRFPDGVYTFDPTVNVIYGSAAKDIHLAETNAFKLPQNRNLDFLTTKPFWESITNYDAVLP